MNKMDKIISFIFIVLMSVSSAHGCNIISFVDDIYEVECENDLYDLTTIIPHPETEEQGYGYYEEDNRHVNDHKINISILNINLDTDWDENYEYMNKHIQKLTINDVVAVPDKISDFTNIKEVVNGNGNVLREIKLYIFLGLTNVQEIRFTYNFIESIKCFPTNHTSNVNLIDLRHNRIETIPNSCFANFPSLTYLDLSHNLIKNINILTFEGLLNLRIIDISFNKVKEIGHSFVRFVNVKTMLLNNNNLTKIIEPNFITMNGLEKLDVSSNMLSFIEETSFQNLVNIRELDLSYNNLTRIKKGTLQNSTKLSKISLAHNPIHTIESNIFAGQNITQFTIDGAKLIGSIEKRSFVGVITDNLNLSCSSIDSIETEAFAESQARILNLTHNKISSISVTSFKGIKFLEILDLSNNNLTRLDFETTDLKKVLVFYVQNNCVSKISKSTFANFVSLKILDLSYNNLFEIEPEIFLSMNQLEFLDVSNNYLAKTLKAQSFQGLSLLNNLHLMFNKFTTIENNTFEGLTSLKFLNCSHGELSSIGYRAFENITSLEIIDFSYNSLRDFIIFANNIASVKELRLNDNAITNITEEMPSIEKLNLANNNIEKLKRELLASSKNLSFLDLSSNNGIDFKDVFENVTYLSKLRLSNIGKQFNFDHIKVSISNLDLSLNDIENVSSILIYKIKGVNSIDLQSNRIVIIDKSCFQNMPALVNLDLSLNSINFIQPGSFLQLNSLKTLNLHGNSIQELQFGVLDGLNNLETLNLSSNSIHQFGVNILRSSLTIKTLALDDNVIESFDFQHFLSTNIKMITIGGNPLSCHTIADFKNCKEVLTVTAEVLDYHTENIDGIKCTTNSEVNKSSTFTSNESDNNASSSFVVLAKAIDGFSASVESFRQTFIKFTLGNNDTKKLEEPTQNMFVSIANNSNFSALMERLIRHWTNISQTTQQDQKLYNRLEAINTFNHLKHDSFTKSNVRNSDDFAELKAMMYFVAACLTVCVFLIISFVIFIIFQRKKVFQSSSYKYSSSEPISIELQDH